MKKVDKNSSSAFAKLTWDDLSDWAGSTIMDRGRNYKQNGHVKDIAFTPSNAFIAWVQGTRRYATTVEMQDNQLISDCTCPYDNTCKHAVAVVLEYLDYLKNKKSLPKVSKDDKRLQLLAEDYTEHYDEDDWDEEVDGSEKEPSKATSQKSKESSLKSYLESQTKEQLISLLEQISSQHPAVKQTLEDMKNVKTGKTAKVILAIRNELASIEERDWDYDYDAGSGGPDWDRIKAQLTALLQSGHANELLDIGEEVLEEGNRAIETYDQEGEVGDEVTECITIVFQALAKCSLSLPKQLQWINKISSEDEYNCCSSGIETFWNAERSKEEWNVLANELQRTLNKSYQTTDNFSVNYHRDKLTDRLITTLKKAERSKEIIPLCERESVITGSYERLVGFLIEDKRWEEAQQWCRRGIEASQDKAGINSQLRDMLYTINQETGNYLVAAALKAENFFADADNESFQSLCKSAIEAGVEAAVEAWARHFLETGEQPQRVNNKPGKQKKVKGFVWPLPDTELKNKLTARQQSFPIISTLIDIAIAEKKPNEVLKWFDHHSRKTVQRGYYDYNDPSLKVAEAIKESHPDRAITIWKQIAEEQIALTNTKSYVTAGNYLRKVRDTLFRTKRELEWQNYLSKLKEVNKRKTSCIKVLNGLSGKPIIDSQ